MLLKSNHIYFRALEPFDLELMYDIENDTEVWKISNTIHPFSKDVLLQYLQSAHQDIFTNKQLRLVICLNDTSEPIGTIDLFEFDPLHLRVGVGILIFKNFRKNGFAQEAIELVKLYSKKVLLMNQLYCNISSSNEGSIFLFEKCGFIRIGIKKQWNRIEKNQFEDEILYQLLL